MELSTAEEMGLKMASRAALGALAGGRALG